MTRRTAINAACLALLAVSALATGNLILTTALAMPDTLAKAETLNGF